MCRFASLTSDASFRSLKCGFTALLRSDNQSSEKEMVDSESMSPLNIEASQNWPVDTRNLVDSTQALSFASQREREDGWILRGTLSCNGLASPIVRQAIKANGVRPSKRAQAGDANSSSACRASGRFQGCASRHIPSSTARSRGFDTANNVKSVRPDHGDERQAHYGA